jgi:hypothetical protein
MPSGIWTPWKRALASRAPDILQAPPCAAATSILGPASAAEAPQVRSWRVAGRRRSSDSPRGGVRSCSVSDPL